MLEACVRHPCCGLVVFSIVRILRNDFSPSVMGKEKGKNGGRVNGL